MRTGSSSIIKIGKSINFNLNSNKLRQLGFSRVQIFDCFSFFFFALGGVRGRGIRNTGFNTEISVVTDISHGILNKSE